MQVSSLYHHLRLPPNLQRHMLEVTAVGEFVCEHWTGEPLDAELVRNTLLMHDLGNIVKFSRPFSGELEEQALYWEEIQKMYQERFGRKATIVTVGILQEIGAEPEVAQILLDMSPDETGNIAFAHWETRICSFADMSVTPQGIEGFEARMVDLSTRYPTDRVRVALAQERSNAEVVQRTTSVPIMTLPRKQLEQRMGVLAQVELAVTVPEYFAELPCL